MTRLLIGSTALFWGLQQAFLSPALALLLVTLYDASAAQVGWVLAVYNASGFVASLLVPAWADRRSDYLRPMMACGVLTVALAVLMGLTTSLPLATTALVVLGGPAGVGTTLLFAHLRYAGSQPADIVNTRAIFSVSWIAGPPLATLVIGAFGDRSVLLAVVAVSVLGVVGVGLLEAGRRRAVARDGQTDSSEDGPPLLARRGVAFVVVAFVLLQATNAAVVAMMTLFVTQSLGLSVVWAGIALGVAAGLEVPALLMTARLGRRFSSLGLLLSSCLAGVAYYVGTASVQGPVLLLALQPLNAWFFAGVAGVGLTLFQQLVPRPGMAGGLYANARRVGAIVSGPLIGLGALTPLGTAGCSSPAPC